MKRRFLLISVLLNVLLGTALLHRIHEKTQAVSPLSTSQVRLEGLDAESTIGLELGAQAGAFVPIGWESIWRGGYRAAAAEFRARGFPESAVQDLVVGRINRRYGPELLRLRRDNWEFWQPEQRRGIWF
jgi:hypothetical protein